jgi:AraC-like DNA-binding protein
VLPLATRHELVERMLNEIHQHYSQEITLAALARRLRQQSAYLGRLFRDDVGITVHKYMTRAQMVFGAAHVRAGVKIESVALDLGYRSKKNFYRQFKRHFDMTPEAYRHRHNTAATSPAPAGQFHHSADQLVNAPDRPVLTHRADKPSTGSRRRKMAKSLRRSSVAMLLTDERGCYVGATETAVILTGYSVDELRGMPAEVLFPNDSASNTRCRLRVLSLASASLPATTMLQTKSAGPIAVHLTSVENVLVGRQRLTAAHVQGAAPFNGNKKKSRDYRGSRLT